MPITANVTNEQITASVGETQIDVSVSGGIGPSGAAGSNGQAATVAVGTVTTGAAGSQASVTNVGTSSAAVFDFTIPAGATGPQGPQGATGPAGTTTWAGITDKPSEITNLSTTLSDIDTAITGKAASSHTHAASAITSGRLNYERLPLAIFCQTVGLQPAGVPENPGDYTLLTVSDGVDTLGTWYADGHISCTAITLAGTDLATTLSGKAAASHAHSASDVTSGTFDIARIPTGTSSTTVCIGNDARLNRIHGYAASFVFG